MENRKIGLYICSGCGIGDALNLDDLEKNGTDDTKPAICRKHEFLCSQDGIDTIKKDISGEGINSICIAACSRRAVYGVFDFEECFTERVNIREQVVWSHKPNDEDTQMMAEDYVRMGLSVSKGADLSAPFIPENMSKDIMVVGGGITGLTAALEGAKAGYNILLVEKEANLGGHQINMKKIAVLPFREIKDNNIQQLIDAVKSHGKIRIRTNSMVEKTEGSPGLFNVKVNCNGPMEEHKIGAIVMAAGWIPYCPDKLPEKLGYGKSRNVITNAMFEKSIKNGKVTCPGGGEPSNVVFIQCAGQRDPEHLSYCSSFCCITALKQAMQVKSQNPDAGVYVVYQEMRTAGHAEELYRSAQKAGVIFIRSQDTVVKTDRGLAVEALDELLGDKVILEGLDLVVLATGIVSAGSVGKDIFKKTEEQMAKENPDELKLPPDVIRESNILNLDYRQGPELPALYNDFPDSHYVCFPYESRRTGIYAAGCVRRPMGISQCIEDGAGAMMKAVQSIEVTFRGATVHPRSLDVSLPEFAMSRCTQCKRCTVECPFGAINEDEKGNPLHQPTRCRRCGICMGACPERIISFKDYSVPIIGNMIKVINVPEEDEEKPRILVLACENDAYPAFDLVGLNRMQYNAWVRVVPLRCLGSMNLVWIADSLSKGIDGIMLLGCKHGDDYQCHMIRGSELSKIRLSKVSETLNRMQLESERVRYESLSITDFKMIPALIEEFSQTIEKVGPNPFKGF